MLVQSKLIRAVLIDFEKQLMQSKAVFYNHFL